MRAGGERTWSRAGGQAADEWGFVIRHECILFIFFKTRPTRRGTDTEGETSRRLWEKSNAKGFVFHERIERRSMCSPVLAP